ncbi:penicillin acylase family protein [Aerophototrophica crusticola]|uniref:penicillin acylase family protein n=1 Tax=Aerophototrophica crusticola TaxID=1709002 RepID=UPI00384B5C73
MVEFAPTGPKARTALTYGNSSRPGSPDITDQLRLYERRELRKVAFTPEEVAAAGVRTVQLPALADGS